MINQHKWLISILLSGCMIFSGIAINAKDYVIADVAIDLEFPWSIAFLPNSDMLVTERTGRLRVIHQGKLVEQSIRGLPEVYVHGQGGLFDVLVDPDFINNKLIYISYASGTRTSNALQVISARLEGMSLHDVNILLTVSPKKDTPHHFGGRMALLGDGTLLITSGEGFNFREQAQSLNSMMGKVLRINTDGTIPKDNPFIDHKEAKPEVYSYGHRNAQAILVSKDGTIWSHEHGPKGGDELNIISKGKNYGWPAITYGLDYSGAVISPFSKAEGMEQPTVYWIPSIAPSGMAEYQGDKFPQWSGNLFVTALAGKSVHRLTLDGSAVVEQNILLTELDARIRDIRTSPDGYLYVLTDSNKGRVIKLLPEASNSLDSPEH